MKRILAYLLILFSLLGIADASFLTWQKLSHTVPPCHTVFKCGEVLNSSWSSIGPVPLSVFGLFFYISFGLLGVLFFLDIDELKIKSFSFKVKNLIPILGTFGALFSLYLVLVMGVIIKAWCFYCLLSALNCGVLFVLSLIIYAKFRKA